MANLIEIILRGKGNAAQAVKNLRKEVSETGKTSSLASKGIGLLGGALAGIATIAVVQQIARAGIELAKLGAQAQGIRGAFSGLGGDIEKMREGAMGMISDVELMRQYNQAAQLVSKTFAKELPEAMGYLAKVSAATGQDMKFMMDSLVRGVGRMSPLILDNLGIQVDLAAATERAAKMFDVQADQLTKTQQQAGLMAETMDKLRENTAAMPEVTGTAAVSLGKLATSILNLRDAAAEWLALHFSDPDGFTADIVRRLTEAIGWLTEKVRDLSNEARKSQVDVESMLRGMANGAIKAREAAATLAQGTTVSLEAIKKWGQGIVDVKTKFEGLWAEVFDPSALQSAMSRWRDIIDNNMTQAFVTIDAHQAREREAQFAHNMERLLATANYEAEKAALLDAGRAEDAARLDAKFNAESQSADAAYSNEQGLLDRNLLVQQVARARAWVAELKAQDTKIRLELTAMVLAAGAQLNLKTGVEKGMLDLIKEGASAQLQVQIDHARASAEIATELGRGQINAAQEMMAGIIAALNQQNAAAQAALQRLQDNLGQFTNNFLNNIRTTFGGDIGLGDVGDNIAEDARRAEETATRALADVARDIDTAISKMLSSIENLKDVTIPEGLDAAFEKLGQFFQQSVAEVHSWITAPDVKQKLDEIRDYLGAVIDLFRVVNVDMSKMKPFDGDFIPAADQFFRQLKAFSGRVYDWMTNEIGPDLRWAVSLAAIIAEDVAKLFKLIGPDMSKVIPAEGAFIPKADAYIRQLKAFSGRAFDWMAEIAEEGNRWAVTLAGQIAEDVAKLFRLLGPDMGKVVPARGAFIPKADAYLRQMQAWSGRVYSWMTSISDRGLRWAVKLAGEVAEDVAKLFGIMGNMGDVVPAQGAFIPKADRYIAQLKAFSGRVKDWMVEILEGGWEPTVALAGELAEKVRKLFSVLDTDLAKVGNTWALMAALRNMDLYFFTLEQMGIKLMDWLKDRSDETHAQVARAASLAADIVTLFSVLDIGAEVPTLNTNFAAQFKTFVDKLDGMLAHALPIFQGIWAKWGDNGVLGLAASVVENVQAIFGGFADIVQSISSAADLGGLDVASAWAMMEQFGDLLNMPAGYTAPTVEDLAGVNQGGRTGPGGGGTQIFIHDWRIILEIPQLGAVATGHVTEEVEGWNRISGTTTLTMVAASV